MARQKIEFICQNCGQIHNRWQGKCDGCNEWNTLVEEGVHGGIGGGYSKNQKKGKAVHLATLSGLIEDAPRIRTSISEFDRVTGGGLVRGSALLIGGDPGIGKSTLLTQISANLSRSKYNIIYVSGEEAVAQIQLRAQRLNATDANIKLAAETNVEDILATLQEAKPIDVVIIDSIQTLWSDHIDSAPGSVGQVRTGAQSMIRFAKQTGTAMILIGHVTKDGQIAGPRVVEHMVDGVLYFEGERNNHYRILRAVKNRFGPTDEIGIFEMSDNGLKEVSNPSQLFLGNRDDQSCGTSVFAGIEGTRPVLFEIESLVAPSSLGVPRRAVVGWDSNRLSMILAVLESHCRLKFGQYDVYLNVAGGFRISEPAADMAVAAALLSSVYNAVLPKECIFLGEISLSGQLRPISRTDIRIKEAQKLGFQKAFLSSQEKKMPANKDFEIVFFKNLLELSSYIKSLKL